MPIQKTVSAISGLLACILVLGGSAAAQTCDRAAFRRIVDETGAGLRRMTSESQPRMLAAFRRLKEQRGWSDDDYVERANELVADQRSQGLDIRASELLAKLDRLADASPGSGHDCGKLAELEATALELQATVKAKSQYLLRRLDDLASAGTPASTTLPPAPAPTPAGEPTRDAAAAPAPPTPAPPAVTDVRPPLRGPVPPTTEARPVPLPRTERRGPTAGWSTSTVETPQAQRQPGPPSPASPPQVPAAPPMPIPSAPTERTFSREEIQEASRGFFGTISSGLGSVIEYSFGQLGRPTGYVLGNEGGGAFIAGIRYGKGTLFTRSGERREVYWHGPSIGYDFGASGTKTLFLVYGLVDDLDIFNGFSGVDGSAFLVGGVGMTLLTDGKLVLAPIRSGVGLRLGASIGYIRFTARPTWNPF